MLTSADRNIRALGYINTTGLSESLVAPSQDIYENTQVKQQAEWRGHLNGVKWGAWFARRVECSCQTQSLLWTAERVSSKEKEENRAIWFSGTSGSWVATLLQLISADIPRRGKLDTQNKMLISVWFWNRFCFLNSVAREITFFFPFSFPFMSGSCRPVAQCVFLFYNQKFEKKSCSWNTPSNFFFHLILFTNILVHALNLVS